MGLSYSLSSSQHFRQDLGTPVDGSSLIHGSEYPDLVLDREESATQRLVLTAHQRAPWIHKQPLLCRTPMIMDPGLSSRCTSPGCPRPHTTGTVLFRVQASDHNEGSNGWGREIRYCLSNSTQAKLGAPLSHAPHKWEGAACSFARSSPNITGGLYGSKG